MSSEDFEFVRGRPDDFDEVLSFLCTYFLYEETMNVALRFTKEEFAPFVAELVTDCLASGHTVLAREKKTDQLAGVVLNNIWRRETSHGEGPVKRSCNPTPSQVIEIFLDTFAQAFWKLVPPDMDAVLHREILSVGSPWQRRGLGSRLIDEGFTPDELRRKGVTGFASKTSSLANQQLMAKKGYDELMSIPFRSVTGVAGRPLVVPQDGTTRNVLLWKRLE